MTPTPSLLYSCTTDFNYEKTSNFRGFISTFIYNHFFDADGLT